MQAKTRLFLLESLQRKKRSGEAFTLIELMVVVAIIGVLAAVAIPRYLQARSAAQAGARIGEAVGLAKECSTYIISQVGSVPTYTSGIAATCNASAGTFNGSWSGTVANLRCLTTVRAAGSTSATVTVDNTGAMSCALS